ncbi:MAG: type II toxin-antitoxin system VapC family toxin [Leptospiraceae bacterium]|nr:type II toxin-antitoxin system VapC family toxin [Leptospiraceae bacterium]
MNGNKFFIDTNIVLSLLNGDLKAKDFLENKETYLSFITELELLSFHKIAKSELANIESFLNDCNIIGITEEIKKNVIIIRSKFKLKLPDAIILASAITLDLDFLTMDLQLKKVYSKIKKGAVK